MNGNSWTESNWAGSELRVVGLLAKIMLYENVVWLLSGVAVEEQWRKICNLVICLCNLILFHSIILTIVGVGLCFCFCGLLLFGGVLCVCFIFFNSIIRKGN